MNFISPTNNPPKKKRRSSILKLPGSPEDVENQPIIKKKRRSSRRVSFARTSHVKFISGEAEVVSGAINDPTVCKTDSEAKLLALFAKTTGHSPFDNQNSNENMQPTFSLNSDSTNLLKEKKVFTPSNVEALISAPLRERQVILQENQSNVHSNSFNQAKYNDQSMNITCVNQESFEYKDDDKINQTNLEYGDMDETCVGLRSVGFKRNFDQTVLESRDMDETCVVYQDIEEQTLTNKTTIGAEDMDETCLNRHSRRFSVKGQVDQTILEPGDMDETCVNHKYVNEITISNRTMHTTEDMEETCVDQVLIRQTNYKKCGNSNVSVSGKDNVIDDLDISSLKYVGNPATSNEIPNEFNSSLHLDGFNDAKNAAEKSIFEVGNMDETCVVDPSLLPNPMSEDTTNDPVNEEDEMERTCVVDRSLLPRPSNEGRDELVVDITYKEDEIEGNQVFKPRNEEITNKTIIGELKMEEICNRLKVGSRETASSKVWDLPQLSETIGGGNELKCFDEIESPLKTFRKEEKIEVFRDETEGIPDKGNGFCKLVDFSHRLNSTDVKAEDTVDVNMYRRLNKADKTNEELSRDVDNHKSFLMDDKTIVFSPNFCSTKVLPSHLQVQLRQEMEDLNNESVILPDAIKDRSNLHKESLEIFNSPPQRNETLDGMSLSQFSLLKDQKLPFNVSSQKKPCATNSDSEDHEYGNVFSEARSLAVAVVDKFAESSSLEKDVSKIGTGIDHAGNYSLHRSVLLAKDMEESMEVMTADPNSTLSKISCLAGDMSKPEFNLTEEWKDVSCPNISGVMPLDIRQDVSVCQQPDVQPPEMVTEDEIDVPFSFEDTVEQVKEVSDVEEPISLPDPAKDNFYENLSTIKMLKQEVLVQNQALDRLFVEKKKINAKLEDCVLQIKDKRISDECFKEQHQKMLDEIKLLKHQQKVLKHINDEFVKNYIEWKLVQCLKDSVGLSFLDQHVNVVIHFDVTESSTERTKLSDHLSSIVKDINVEFNDQCDDNPLKSHGVQLFRASLGICDFQSRFYGKNSLREILDQLSLLSIQSKFFIRELQYISFTHPINITESKLTIKLFNYEKHVMFNVTFSIDLTSYPDNKPSMSFANIIGSLSEKDMMDIIADVNSGPKYIQRCFFKIDQFLCS